MDASIKGSRPGRPEKQLQAKLAALGERLSESKAHRAADGLGWFSLGLGALELGAPKAVAALTGAGRTLPGRLVVRGCGGRELLAGAGILGPADPGPWLWARVAGDVMDLGLLGAAFLTRRWARNGSRGRLRLLLSASSIETGRCRYCWTSSITTLAGIDAGLSSLARSRVADQVSATMSEPSSWAVIGPMSASLSGTRTTFLSLNTSLSRKAGSACPRMARRLGRSRYWRSLFIGAAIAWAWAPGDMAM